MKSIFISYSHLDPQYLGEIKTWINAQGFKNRVKVETDEGIAPGDDWHRWIQEQIDKCDAAILIITQKFMASEYISDEEMSRLLKRHHKKQTTLYPIFYEYSTVQDDEFSFEYEGQQCTFTLPKLQGVAAPDKPLYELKKHERDKHLMEFARLLKAKYTLLETKPINKSVARDGPVEKNRWITIRLEISGDELTRSISSQSGPVMTTSDNWLGFSEHVESMHLWAQRPEFTSISSELPTWKNCLFRILFGDPNNCEELFSKLNGATPGAERPVFQPYHVYINTDNRKLIDLPWQLCDWRDMLRTRESQWRFATSGTDIRKHPVNIKCPYKVSIIHDDGDVATDSTSNIVDTLCSLFPLDDSSAEKDRWIRVSDINKEPELNTLSDHGVDSLFVLFTGNESAGVLQNIISRTKDYGCEFQSIHLCLPSSLRQAGIDPVLVHLNELSDLLTIEWMDDTPRAPYTTQWLHFWLRHKNHPLDAWYEIIQPDLLTAATAATIQLHLNQANWEFINYREGVKEPLERIFDRYSLKNTLSAALLEITRTDSSVKVYSITLFGTGGDHPAQFSDTMLHHLRSRSFEGLPIVERGPLYLPNNRDNLIHDLDGHLRKALPEVDADYIIPLKQVFDNAIPPAAREEARAQGRKPVIWLNWGTFGKARGLSDPLTLKQIGNWLEYTKNQLLNHCPNGAVIVNILAIETANDKNCDRLNEDLRKLYKETTGAIDFRFQEPARLEKIDASHVKILFSENPTIRPSGSDDYVNRVAHAVEQKSKGNFDQAVLLLQRGVDRGWDHLSGETESPGISKPIFADDDEPY